MNNKICVYTCITGNYDNIKEIENKEKGIDYYCFTNNKNIKSKTWNVVYISDDSLSNVELARKIKILGDPSINNKYDILVWMDGAVTFKKKIKDFVNTYLDKDDSFVAFKHGERENIHDECAACFRYKKETKEKINKLLSFYEKEKYPDNNGLIESTVYIKRPKDKKVIDTMKLWFDMIINYTHRDQLSFNYCIYKTNLKVKWINEKVFDNEWFLWVPHVSNKQIKDYRIYFGDEINYDINLDVQGKYHKKEDEYSFKVQIPADSEFAVINVTDSRLVKFWNIKINNYKSKDYDVFNYIDYQNSKIFYNNDSIIRINKTMKKGDYLSFSICMKNLEEDEINNFINAISCENIISSQENKILKSNLNSKDEYIDYLNKVIKFSLVTRTIMKFTELKNRKKN